MKTRNMLTMSPALIVVAALGVSLPERHASAAPAEIGNLPTIRSIALGRGLEPSNQLLVMLALNNLGLLEFRANSFDNNGNSVSGHGLARQMYGLNEEPLNSQPFNGTARIATSSFHLDEYRLSRDSSGALQLTGPITSGPFGDSALHGRPKAFAVLPQPRDPSGPWFAIGTDTGNIILAKAGIQPCQLPVGGPVVDLAVVPQVGYFAFVALVNRRDGQHLVGFRPPDTGGCSTAPGQVVFDMAPDSPVAIGFDTHAFIEPAEGANVGGPLNEPAPLNLIATNGTRFIHRLTIPAEPSIGGSFRVQQLKASDSPIAQVAVGPSSLALLPVDGAGVLYDPGFRIDRGGVSGKLLTIFGNSLEVRPRQFSLQGRRRSVSIFIEVAGRNAALIDRTSIQLTFGGTTLANDLLSPQLPADNDHDGNLDLEVKINRDAVQSLVPIGATSVTIAASWRFNDGSLGRASAEIRIKPTGDDDDDDGD